MELSVVGVVLFGSWLAWSCLGGNCTCQRWPQVAIVQVEISPGWELSE